MLGPAVAAPSRVVEGSLRARELLDHWAEARAKFVKVYPHEYKRALGEMHAAKQAGSTIAKAKAADAKQAVAGKVKA